MALTLLVDFGSTYTKLVAVDLAGERVVGVVQAPSSVGSDIMVGLNQALEKLRAVVGEFERPSQEGRVLACSSAAGGLRMVAVGLVPELTAEAARRAALGAGAKVLRVFSHRLSQREVAEMESIAPDMVLLAGGTDGGDEACLLHNGAALAKANVVCPVVVAGNKVVADDTCAVLTAAGKRVRVTRNVMPELGELDVEPARAVIRELFMEHIVEAKGLHLARQFVGDIIMPTPMAVLSAAKLLADGTESEAGIGELVVADVGGATTDIHSVSRWDWCQPGVVLKGLPEPYAKRTVEGDLGIRVNAHYIVEMAGKREVSRNLLAALHEGDLESAAAHLSVNTATVPRRDEEYAIDTALARTAVDAAMQRHAGTIKTLYTPSGAVWIQVGKDLTEVRQVIGTGGVFSHGRHPRHILEGAAFKESDPTSLRPKAPCFLVDRQYIMYAVGLLSSVAPDAALRIMKRDLEEV